jgi:hypothetical protein
MGLSWRLSGRCGDRLIDNRWQRRSACENQEVSPSVHPGQIVIRSEDPSVLNRISIPTSIRDLEMVESV